MDKISNYFSSLINDTQHLTALIISVILFFVLFFLRNKLSKAILNALSKILFRNKKEYRQPLIDSLKKPLGAFFGLLGIFSLVYINYCNATILKIFKICVILVICSAVVNYLSNNLFLLFHFGRDADSKMDTTAIKFISNIMKIIVILFAVVMIISELGYNINGLLTGIGVGGLAVSLAAQEAVADLIGGFIILFDKPFIVGDMIQTNELQGYVEDVTMRSTKVRTLEDSIITVPNSKLADSAIINLSRIEKRLINIEVGLEYSTTNETIEKCKADITEYLKGDPIISDNPLRVNVAALGESSINIEITCYCNTPDLDEYLKTVSRINLDIKKIAEKNKASFAFPSTSVYIEKN